MKRRWASCVGRSLAGLTGAGIVALAGLVGAMNWQIHAREIYPAAQDAPGQFVTVNGFSLHVSRTSEVRGTSIPILLIHGFGVNGSEEWRYLTPELGRPVIAPDLLGFGHSQRVGQPHAAYSHRGQAALLAGLLDALGIEQVDVVGASYGGGVAIQFALDYPARVRRLALIDAQVYASGGGVFQTLGTLPLGIGRAFTWMAQGAGPLADSLQTMGCGKPDFCPDADFLARRARLAQIIGTTDALIAFSCTPRDARFPADLSQLAVPTLIVWGEADTIVPLAEGQQLAREIPGARLVTLPGVGHTPHLQAPAQTAALLMDLLQP